MKDYKEKYEHLAKSIKDLYPYMLAECKEKAERMILELGKENKMGYKEKYEQALERAKVINPGTADYEVAVKIFPELKESEDEKVRKWLIEMVEEVRKANPTNAEHNGNCSEAIAWLEKQGEFKPIFRVGDYIRNKKTKDRVLIEQIDIANKVYCYVSRDDAAEIHSDFRFSEQNDWEIIGQKIVEQKPVWSDEDERMLGYALDMVEWYIGRNETKCRSVSDWLKSIKHKLIQL